MNKITTNEIIKMVDVLKEETRKDFKRSSFSDQHVMVLETYEQIHTEFSMSAAAEIIGYLYGMPMELIFNVLENDAIYVVSPERDD